MCHKTTNAISEHIPGLEWLSPLLDKSHTIPWFFIVTQSTVLGRRRATAEAGLQVNALVHPSRIKHLPFRLPEVKCPSLPTRPKDQGKDYHMSVPQSNIMLETECLPQACFTHPRWYGENSLEDGAHPWGAYCQPLAPIRSVLPDPP